MPSTYRRRSPLDRPPLGRRATGLALALAINLAVILALLGVQASKRIPKSFTDRLVIFDLAPDSPKPEERAAQTTQTKEPQPTPPRIPRENPPPVIEIPRKLDMIELTPQEYADADIAKLPKAAGQPGVGSSAGDSEEVGRGPSGQILYAAEWWRRPTDAEVGGYLPPNAPEGYGLIACRTVANYRVEDCVELENYPRGSRLAGAVRQAAWQFRVRPPRVNGREMVGEWVRIRIDYHHVRRNPGS